MYNKLMYKLIFGNISLKFYENNKYVHFSTRDIFSTDFIVFFKSDLCNCNDDFYEL